MARTLRAAAQVVRREAFVDAALRLVQAKGYEQMSVQDVLDELDASKGAFYHYFDSKRALLEACVERITDTAMATLEPLLNDPDRPAVSKLQGFFNGIAAWKNARRELMLALIETWASDDNAIVREKFRRSTARRLQPVLAGIVRQGAGEGAFAVASPEDTAAVLVAFVHGMQVEAAELFFARQAGEISVPAVERRLRTFAEAMERILGLPAGSFPGLDETTLHMWFA